MNKIDIYALDLVTWQIMSLWLLSFLLCNVCIYCSLKSIELHQTIKHKKSTNQHLLPPTIRNVLALDLSLGASELQIRLKSDLGV